jgi:lysophospholipase L1-like esterase
VAILLAIVSIFLDSSARSRMLRQLRPFALALFAALQLDAAAHATPDNWAADIDHFTATDTAHPPPQGADVFVGSSSILFWTTLAQDFPGVASINRGFGGSELADSVFYADRIVIPYHPRLVVLYAGENDLWNGKTPGTVAADFKTFRTKLHAALPETKLLFLAIKESPAYAKVREQVFAANKFIAADCATDARCTFVDVATPLLDEKGRTRPELFRDDQLHLAPAGYAIWTKVLAPYLKE